MIVRSVPHAMTELNDERWAFVVEWFDSSADLVRQYQLLYYLVDSTLEMVRNEPCHFPRPLAATCQTIRCRGAVTASLRALASRRSGACPPPRAPSCNHHRTHARRSHRSLLSDATAAGNPSVRDFVRLPTPWSIELCTIPSMFKSSQLHLTRGGGALIVRTLRRV